ncbi:MAG: hypothetical protein ACQESW_06170 [Bacteroidota bacterium]
MKLAKHLFTTILVMLTASTFAQRGTGNNQGVGAMATTPEVHSVTGSIEEVVDEPCTETTGKYAQGRHLVITTSESTARELNIHLGPTTVVKDLITPLNRGDKVTFAVFATPDLPENHYIAQEVHLEDEVVTLRSSNLSPVWSNRSTMNQNGRRRGKGFRRD